MKKIIAFTLSVTSVFLFACATEAIEIERHSTVESISKQSVQGDDLISPYHVTGEALVQLIQKMADFDTPGSKIIFNRRSAQLFVRNTPSNQEIIGDVLANMRKAVNRQVDIEARIITVGTTDVDDLGLNSLSFNANATSNGTNVGTGSIVKALDADGNPIRTSSSFIGFPGTTDDEGGHLSFSVLSSDVNLDAVVDALKSKAEVNTLSCPRIIVANNQRANIKIEKAQYYVQALESDVNSSAVATDPSIGVAQSGTVLDVTPTINSDGTISLDLHPVFVTADLSQTREIQVSDRLDNQPSVTLPEFTVQQADTTVTIPNGGVAAIAGLVEEIETKTMNKVPVFGDIPLLGKALFSSTQNQEEKKHLVIFVKAKVKTTKTAAKK